MKTLSLLLGAFLLVACNEAVELQESKKEEKTYDAKLSGPRGLEGKPRNEPIVCEEPAFPVKEELSLQRPIIGLGVNFEDQAGSSDRDFNDVMLCLEGEFEDGKDSIISSSEQQLKISTSGLADCDHEVTVLISREQEEVEVKLDSKTNKIQVVELSPGDKLEISMRPTSGFCDKSFDRVMHDKKYAKIKSNVCHYSAD